MDKNMYGINSEGQGNKYRSQTEKKIGDILENLGINFKYETELIKYTQVLQRNYKPDFIVNGVYYEVKGRFTNSDRQKHKAIKLSNPDLKIIFVFQNYKNKLYKGSKNNYGDWCNKNGFEWTTLKDFEEFIKRNLNNL